MTVCVRTGPRMDIDIACLFEEKANDEIVFSISRHRKERQYLFNER